MSNRNCQACPHLCNLADEEIGFCGVLQNIQGQIVNPKYGCCSHISFNSIEKRPLFHFLPGSRVMSVGMLGCSFHCSYCQSFKISQGVTASSKFVSPSDLVKMAGDDPICFTYNEPTIHYEYIRDVGEIRKGHIILKTNGFATDWLWDQILPVVSALNIDIKGDDKEYHRVCKGSLAPVLHSIENVVGHGKHVEISYLVLPSLIDDFAFHGRMRDFLSRLKIPLHILYLYPFYEMSESYEEDKILRVWEFFAEKMPFVYISNLYSEKYIFHRTTYCPSCSEPMIERSGGVKIRNLTCCDHTPFIS